MVRVFIDPNVRVGQNQTYASLADCSGAVATGDRVRVVEFESCLYGDADVVSIDAERGLVYLSVEWASLKTPDVTSPWDGATTRAAVRAGLWPD